MAASGTMQTTPAGRGVKFDFYFDPPLEEFHFELNRFAAGISDYTTYFAAIAELFKGEMMAQFATQGDASGGEWAYYKDAPDGPYTRMKEDLGLPVGVLSGKLRSAMTGGDGWMEVFGPTEAEFGQSDAADSAAYGWVFDAGNENQQARPIMRMTAEWGTEWQYALHDWVLAETRDAFFTTGGAGALLAPAYAGQMAGM